MGGHRSFTCSKSKILSIYLFSSTSFTQIFDYFPLFSMNSFKLLDNVLRLIFSFSLPFVSFPCFLLVTFVNYCNYLCHVCVVGSPMDDSEKGAVYMFDEATTTVTVSLISNTMSLSLTMALYPDDTFTTAHTSAITLQNNQHVYIGLKVRLSFDPVSVELFVGSWHRGPKRTSCS